MKGVEEIGQNAGKIWKVLNLQGPLTESRLMNSTMLDENQLHAAIGWLARENKISKNGSFYKLGETNLTEKIGVNAGKLWETLAKNNEIDISAIAKLARLDEKDAYSALGWLAREDKIESKNLIKLKR
ncbi:MAG: winged helix-turn-helix domain-containing protein [Candidatus Thermoplasmatota archaeon]|jgi:hypothetical protein|nr:winged helix-turn-helix domain-containing protein [Candidatus Thermoplasmatota archaeon]